MDLFLANGYERTGTKAIAEAAGVQEPLIFRHFSSKSRLLEQTVLFSLQTFAREFEQEFEQEPYPNKQALLHSVAHYTLKLYQLLSQERELLIALFASTGNRSVERHPVHEALAPLFEKLTAMGQRHKRRGALNPWFTVRLTFGLLVSAIVLEDWLFPWHGSLKKKQLPTALVQYVVGGSMYNQMMPRRLVNAASGSKRKSKKAQ